MLWYESYNDNLPNVITKAAELLSVSIAYDNGLIWKQLTKANFDIAEGLQ